MVCYFTLTFLPKAVTYKMGLGIYHILDHYVEMNKNYMYNTFTGVFPTVLSSGVYIDLKMIVSINKFFSINRGLKTLYIFNVELYYFLL